MSFKDHSQKFFFFDDDDDDDDDGDGHHDHDHDHHDDHVEDSNTIIIISKIVFITLKKMKNFFSTYILVLKPPTIFKTVLLTNLSFYLLGKNTDLHNTEWQQR